MHANQRKQLRGTDFPSAALQRDSRTWHEPQWVPEFGNLTRIPSFGRPPTILVITGAIGLFGVFLLVFFRDDVSTSTLVCVSSIQVTPSVLCRRVAWISISANSLVFRTTCFWRTTPITVRMRPCCR